MKSININLLYIFVCEFNKKTGEGVSVSIFPGKISSGRNTLKDTATD